MRNVCARGLVLICVWLGLSFSVADAATATNLLVWNKDKDRVDADVRGWELSGLLERIASETGWHIYLEPDTAHEASVKFKNLASGEALRLLLGNLNFALVPQTNGFPHLYVFRTSMNNATQPVRAAALKVRPVVRRVPNELVVQLKPGVNIDELARMLGAKVVGRIPELNAYRLQFEDEAAVEAARAQLAANPEVASVQDNYYVDNPPPSQQLAGITAPNTQLKLNPPASDACKVVIGLVDTTVQPLGTQLEPFIKQRVSLAGESSADNSSPLHGTAMANALLQAMQISGNDSTAVTVISVDVFGKNKMANTFDVANGMITAPNLGATVVNTSLGGYGDSPLLRDAVQQLSRHGIPVFAAVGNDGSSSPFFPAAYPQVVSVTAVERGKVAAYANVGTQPDAAAPGAVIFSFNGQVYGSRGTSVSSAAATGYAAGLADSTCAPWSQVIPLLEKNLAVPSATQP